jgi:hypothetical protein
MALRRSCNNATQHELRLLTLMPMLLLLLLPAPHLGRVRMPLAGPHVGD